MKQTDRQPNRCNVVIEVLEPRILYSADPVAGAMDMADGEDSLETLLDDTVSLLEQQAAARPELVFIDSRTPDHQQLIDALAEDESRTFSVIMIDAQESGLEVVSETLSEYQDIAAIHLVSHGGAGEITLGTDLLNTDSLAEQAGVFSGWGEALRPGADLLIYGCDLAASEEGEQLADALARLTGADVAASDDLTGSSSQGGDWDLEYRSGTVETSIAFNADGLQSWQGVLANTAPVLAGANDLTTISEDPLTNSGTLVSALIAGQVTDPDPDASGIAVVAVDNTHGSWEYTTNAGGSWSAFGSPSTSAAVLLASDANTFVRFVPDADWNGTVSDGITFHAWDQSSGTAGGTADLTSGTANLQDHFGNLPSYGNNHGTATWTADWVENDSDGPVDVFTGNFRVIVQSLEIFSETTGDWIYREGDLSGATTATLSFTYDNNLAGAQQVDLQVSSNGGASFTTIDTFTVGNNFGTGTISTDISAYIASNLQVRFYVDNGESANPTKKLTIDDFQIAFDGGPGVGGVNAFSAASASSDITVTAVNDLPAGLPSITGTVTEDQTLTVDTSGISDADGLGSFSYQWLRNGSDISGATGTGYVLGDADVGAQISVRVAYTDGDTTNELVTSVQTAAVANINDLPAGLPSITGTVTEDQTLTVDTSGISDADGLGSFSYQWLRDGSDIGGATGTSYVLGNADVGAQISVRVSYTDGDSINEMVTSVLTAAVNAAPQVPEPAQESIPDIAEIGPAIEEQEEEDQGEEEEQQEQEAEAAAATVDEQDEESIAESEETLSAEPPVAEGGEQLLPVTDVRIPQPVDTELLAEVISDEQQGSRGDGNGGAGYQFEPYSPLKTLGSLDLNNIEIAEYKTGAAEYVRLQSQTENTAFINSLAEMNRDLDASHEEQQQSNTIVKETVIGVTMSLSVGVISWVFKSGSLLASFMSVAPLWKQFDPLPVLGDKQGKEGTLAPDESGPDSQVENLFNQQGGPADKDGV